MPTTSSPSVVLSRMALLVGLLLAPGALAKTVVCISQDGDRYTNIAEGYYRQLVAGQNGAVVNVGTTAAHIRDCLAQVAANDTLIVAGHGWQSVFKWGPTLHGGFSGGRAANGTGAVNLKTKVALPTIPLPANFVAAGINITGTVTACYSASALKGGRSVVTSLQNGIAAAAPAVSGFTGEAMMVAPSFRLTGGNVAQRNAAFACLGTKAGANTSAAIRLWLATFRPPTSGANPNAQTEADSAISNANCAGAGGKVSITMRYDTAPWNRPVNNPPAAPAMALNAFTYWSMDAGMPPPGDMDAGMPPPGDMDAGMPPPGDMDAGMPPPGDMDAGMPPPGDVDAGMPPPGDPDGGYDDGGYYESPPEPLEFVSAGCCEWGLDGEVESDGSEEPYGFGY